MNPVIPLVFAGIYFGVAILLNLKRMQKALSDKINLSSPMILFSLRFFMILGLMILPAAAYEFYSTGSIDFRFHSIAMPMIYVMTPCVQVILSVLGLSTNAIPEEGGITLALADNSFMVFVGILCSGVTSLSVFVAAFIALAWDMKADIPKKAGMLIIGVLGTIFSNIIRISTLFVVGLYYGTDAMTLMHTHLGWILYFLWITIFWFLAFKFGGMKFGKNKATA